MAKPYPFRRVNEVAGAFVLAVVALLLGMVFVVGGSQGWFIRGVRYKLDLPDEGAMGLREGADVSVLGSVVGTVRTLGVRNGRMEAEIAIKPEFAQFVRVDSRATIRRPLGFGDVSVEITRGAASAPALRPGDPIHVTSEPGATAAVEQAVAELRREIVPAIQQARQTFAQYGDLAADLRRPDGHLNRALAHLDTISGNVEKGEGLAGRILSDRALADQASGTVPKVNAAIDEFHATVRDLHATTSSLTEESQQALKELRAVLDDMKKSTAPLPETTRSISRTAEALPGLVMQVQETMRQVQRVAEGLQRSFLVRGSMAPEEAGGNGGGAAIRPENIGSGGR
jgi:ABC-type transporter Mla subunit MlaD